MTDLRKVDRKFFDEYIYPRLGAARDDVALDPTHGVDFGLLDIDGTTVAIAIDPLSVFPALGFERAEWFTIDIVLSDIAVSGPDFSHLAAFFTLPSGMTDDQLAELWGAMHDKADNLSASIITGHTARYVGCSYLWVDGVAALVVSDHDGVVRPDDAKPGDDVFVMKEPGVEATDPLTTLFPDAFSDLDADVFTAAQDRLDGTDVVRDAITTSAAGDRGAYTMHDATEYGVRDALNEITRSAGVQLEVSESSIPLRPGTREACECPGVDPWRSTTVGSPVIVTDPSVTDDVVAALDARGTPVDVAGTVIAGEGIVVDGERIKHPDADPSWAAYERLVREADESGADK